MLFATFPYASRLRLLALPMLYQRSGLQKVVRATGILKAIPERFAAMESLLPYVPDNIFRKPPALTRPATQHRRRVGSVAGLCAAGLLSTRQRSDSPRARG
jgi:glycolate oxidase iron-sulfur subunit